ncbi:hypothetical protein [Prescottella agglutinans]|uniref:hypothetical protein n=1 Tax=Prescottella agglutinans TaxID=1644129 RepID=UPI0024759C1E|nr:hypothetical protein [Prescottella agglutinans]
MRTTLGTVALAAGAAAALTAFAPGTAGADTLVPEPPSPFGSLGSFDPSGGMQTVLGQFGAPNITRVGSANVIINGQPATGSLGSLGFGSLGFGSLDLGSSSGSLGSTSAGSFGSNYGSVVSTPWN